MYDLMAATIVPRPIALVSTVCPEGTANLAPFSFFMPGGTNPPSLAFSPTLGKDGVEKDTLRNIRETGEFVVNLVHRSMADPMNLSAKALPRDESEWEFSGLTMAPCSVVKPARVQESVVSFECRLVQVVGHGEGAGAARYVIGEVVAAHVDERFVQEDLPTATGYRPIARMGGAWYFDTDACEPFEMRRP